MEKTTPKKTVKRTVKKTAAITQPLPAYQVAQKIIEEEKMLSFRTAHKIKQEKIASFQKVTKALRSIAKKHDAELRTKILANYEDLIKKPPKEKPGLGLTTFPSFSYDPSLPITVSEEAQKIMNNLKSNKVGQIRFPVDMKHGGDIYLINGKTEQKIGELIFDTVDDENESKDINSLRTGIFIEVALTKGGEGLLKFIIRAPRLPTSKLPTILRSSKSNDQGGLTHRLKLTPALGKKE